MMTLTPHEIDRLYHEATQLQGQSKFAPSLAPLKKIVQHVPHHFPAWYSLGQSYIHLNNLQEALNCLHSSLKYCADFYPASLLMADVLYKSLGQAQEAEAILLNLKSKNPDIPEIYLHLGEIHLIRSEYQDVQNNLLRFIEKQKKANQDLENPVDTLEQEVMAKLNVDPFLSSTKAEEENLQRLSQALNELSSWPSASDKIPQCLTYSTFYLAYYDINPRKYLEQVSQTYRHLFPALNWTSPHCQKSHLPKKKITLGIVSAYLDKLHAIGYCFAPLVKALDRNLYDLVYFRGYSHQQNVLPIELKERLGKIRTIDLPQNLEDARKLIARQEVDILWYTDINMLPQTYFLAHARLAPVQCVSSGHPTTTGIDTMDHFLSSEVLEPKNGAEGYSENLIKLPTLPIIYEDFKETPALKSREDFGLPGKGNLYFCAQTLFKIHPAMDQIFKGILENDPDGFIIFSYGTTPLAQQLSQRFKESLGTLSQRCLFIPAVPQHDFFSLLTHMDVSLDSFPCGGGNTTFQAISMGLPIVTLKPQYMRSGSTAALYKLMGCSELMADSFNQYALKAVQIAQDKAYREDLRQKILQNKHLIFSQEKEVVEAYNQLFQSLSQHSSARGTP